MGIVEAWELFEDGEISLDAIGDILLEDGWPAGEVRETLSIHTRYPIPVGYFGEE